MLDRLRLTEKRLREMADGLLTVAGLHDPVGGTISGWLRPNGLRIEKIRVPIGVIVVIYESRPNVTADAAALCLKAGNAIILRGGKEALNSNLAIHSILAESLEAAGLPRACIQIVDITDHAVVGELVKATGLVDLVIPRGGEGLIRAVAEQATVPVIKHYKGVCHTYVDKAADLDLAMKVCLNAKLQRPGVCNSMETLLVHRAVAAEFLPGIAEELKKAGCELRGCEESRKVIPSMTAAADEDWDTEYADLILSVKLVGSVEEAVEHIAAHGSQHSDAIISDDIVSVSKFVDGVDSSAVFVNTSTRFNDGGQFGMGAEIGISTDKLHARGPMGLEELTSYKYVVTGRGQVRE